MLYIIKRLDHNYYIENAVIPARLSSWTDDIANAQKFESLFEVKEAVEFIKRTAFNCIVIVLPNSTKC
jgi:hypothetical protein